MSSSRRVRITVPLVVLAAQLGATLALQLLAGGVRSRSLGPLVLAISAGCLGGLITAHRPNVRLGPLLTVTGLGFGLGSLAASALDYGAAQPIPRLAGQAAFAVVSLTRVFLAAWVLFILWFPDGRFTGRGWRRYAVGSVILCGAFGVLVWLIGPADRVFDFYAGTRVPAGAGGPSAGAWPAAGAASNLLLLLPLIALGSLVARYRRGDPVLRQQLRWLLLASSVTIVAQLVGALLLAQGSVVSDVGLAVSIVTQPLPMIGAAVAILRYRLWEIDLVISRALVYGVLWGALTGALLVPAPAAGLLVGGSGAGAAVGIALLVTLVFQPVRRRLEALAERVVYRHRARPYVLLSGFWETLRAADLERIGPLVADAVRTCLHVEWAGVWLYTAEPAGGTLRPLGVTATATVTEASISAAAAEQLRGAHAFVLSGMPAVELHPLWTRRPEAVVPLVAADELLGLLACGGRRGDRLRAADFELLELLARECALRLRNLGLEAQLRHRLAQIEAQASELAKSRQRLVTAQDEERRRIERNLHDGVQQQLVSLAARLHRAAADGAPQLADLAAEAEYAVFALQELGRGIYPSVLADHGLPAALRAQAARMPIAVHLEIDGALADDRPDRDIEAALYFVALEALTNAYKHAHDAAISVWLRADTQSITLEVVDTGPGLAEQRGTGSGLQNMQDRIAAVGGTLSVGAHPGRGTCVAASVPTAGPLPDPPHHPLAADSRR